MNTLWYFPQKREPEIKQSASSEIDTIKSKVEAKVQPFCQPEKHGWADCVCVSTLQLKHIAFFMIVF